MLAGHGTKKLMCPLQKRSRLDDQPGPSHPQSGRQNASSALRQIDWDIHAQASINFLHGRLSNLERQLAELRSPIALEAAPHTAHTLTLALHNASQVFNTLISDSDQLSTDLTLPIQQATEPYADPEARLWRDRWGTDPAGNAMRVLTNLGALHDRRVLIEVHIAHAENLLSSLGQDFSTAWFKF